MIATRAYIAGIGTSGVLLAFAALLLIVLGALLGFRGWPGGSTAQGVDRLVLEEPDRPLNIARVAAADRDAEGARSPGGLEADGGTTGADGGGGAVSSGSAAPLTGSTGGRGQDRVGGGDGAGGPIGPAEGVPSAAPGSTPPAGPGPDPLRRAPVNLKGGISPVTDGLGGRTQDLFQNLGVQVEPLSQPLGGVVRDGGAEVGGGLIDLGNAGDGALPPLDQGPLPVPVPVQAPVALR